MVNFGSHFLMLSFPRPIGETTSVSAVLTPVVEECSAGLSTETCCSASGGTWPDTSTDDATGVSSLHWGLFVLSWVPWAVCSASACKLACELLPFVFREAKRRLVGHAMERHGDGRIRNAGGDGNWASQQLVQEQGKVVLALTGCKERGRRVPHRRKRQWLPGATRGRIKSIHRQMGSGLG